MPALACGWVNFPILWPHTPVQMKLKCPPPLREGHLQIVKVLLNSVSWIHLPRQNRVIFGFSARIHQNIYGFIHPQRQNRVICNFKEFFQIVGFIYRDKIGLFWIFPQRQNRVICSLKEFFQIVLA